MFIVNKNDIAACFDSDITEDAVKAIADIKPLYVYSATANSVGTNFDQIFCNLQPEYQEKKFYNEEK